MAFASAALYSSAMYLHSSRMISISRNYISTLLATHCPNFDKISSWVSWLTLNGHPQGSFGERSSASNTTKYVLGVHLGVHRIALGFGHRGLYGLREAYPHCMPGTACSGRSLAVDLTEVASASRINEDPLTATSISLNFHRFLLAFALDASLAELQLAGPDEPRLGVPALQSALLFAVLPGQHRLADWAEQDIVFTAVPRPIQHELALFVALAAGREVEYSRAAPGCT